ncbi:MAG: DUF4271 domain-containing protein [Chitinophagales bacterium]|nr:DUF4271 domain-containing protein [Chitinophagales bacterium]MDW8426972.1 DUF4271 domain-containing protein [Chitinophagales bacterium]
MSLNLFYISLLSYFSKLYVLFGKGAAWSFGYAATQVGVAFFLSADMYSPQHGLPAGTVSQDWLFWTLLALAALLTALRMIYRAEFQEFGWVLRRWGYHPQLQRELSVGIPLAWVLMNGFAVMVLSVYMSLVATRYQWVRINPPWLAPLWWSGIMVLLFLVRYLYMRAASVLLPNAGPLRYFLYYEFQLLRVTGVVLFPLVILIAFARPPVADGALYASFGLLMLLVAIRFAKGFSVTTSLLYQRPVHFFLYLCSLEIAPIVILVRWAQNVGQLSMAW